MKKAIYALLVVSVFSFASVSTSSIAYAHCGKCGIESSEKHSHGKKWYNPLSWFKNCKSCCPSKAEK